MFCFQFRNQYDNDVTTWSPQGRLHQVEYAMEAVKQGSATVGLKSKTHAVLVALKRASSELSAYQKKIMPLDDHMGMSIAGLTADAKSLSRWMRTECLSTRYYYESALRLDTLMSDLGNKMQACIQGYNKRPYGVGLLVAGFDDLGPHIYQVYDARSICFVKGSCHFIFPLLIRFVPRQITMIVVPMLLEPGHSRQEHTWKRTLITSWTVTQKR